MLNPVPTEWPEYWAATRNSLRLMAEGSGGFAQEENQSLADVLRRIGQIMRR